MARIDQWATLCPGCGSAERKVLNTKKMQGVIYRRSECHVCSTRYTTHERVIADQIPATSHVLARLMDALGDIERDLAKLRASIDANIHF